MMKKSIAALIFMVIVSFALSTRFTGSNWDQGQHLHPDERFLTMVATNIQWTDSLFSYLDTASSTLNPHNMGFDFYVYGTWPVFLVKGVAEGLGTADYHSITLVGRLLSGAVDILILILVFFIGKRLTHLLYARASVQRKMVETQRKTMLPLAGGLVGMLCYTLMTLPIQLSHFYTVDPYQTLFVTLAMLLLLYPPSIPLSLLLGVSVGTALATKISSGLIFPVIFLYGVVHLLATVSTHRSNLNKDTIINTTSLNVDKNIISNKVVQLSVFYSLFAVCMYLSLRLLMPYLFANSGIITFSLNSRVLENWKTLQALSQPDAWYPPGVQWINHVKIFSPLANIVLVGLGLPLSVLLITAGIGLLKYVKNRYLIVIVSFILLTLVYQGIQFAAPMRYFWPVFPLVASLIGTAFALNIPWLLDRPVMLAGTAFIFITAFIPPLSYMSIYKTPHTRVLASYWIYEHIPPGSTISYEHWDDPLPLPFPLRSSQEYTGIELPMFYEDGAAKWQEITAKLDTVQYIVLSSNRVYGSTISASDRYPQTALFYSRLFSGQLGFTKIAEFTSRPSLPIPGINVCLTPPILSYGAIDRMYPQSPDTDNGLRQSQRCPGITFVDDYAEESFTVYDHPKVTIFQKNASYTTPLFDFK